jgi:hypothetical protein
VIARWLCKHFGHRWLGIQQMEHICTSDMCMRCGEVKAVHLWGPWPHTCDEMMGEAA